LHQVAFVAPAAVEIVKERGCFRQNAFAASAGSLPDIRVARESVPGRGARECSAFVFRRLWMSEWRDPDRLDFLGLVPSSAPPSSSHTGHARPIDKRRAPSRRRVPTGFGEREHPPGASSAPRAGFSTVRGRHGRCSRNGISHIPNRNRAAWTPAAGLESRRSTGRLACQESRSADSHGPSRGTTGPAP